MTVELASGYVSIIPSAKGIAASLATELGAPVEAAAAQAGSRASASLSGRFSSGIKGLGAKAGKTIAVGLAGGFALAGAGAGILEHIGSTLDSADDIIRSKTGKTGAALAGLDKSFNQVFSSVPASADDVATALSAVNQRLGLTGKPLQALTQQVLLLSHETGTDLQSNLGSIVPLLAQWNVKGSQSTEVVNELFRASQRSGVGVGELASQLVSSGVQFRSVGLDLRSSTALLALLGKAGLSASDVIPAISRSLATAAKQGKPAQKFFRDTFEQIRKAPNDTKAASVALGVFGARSGPKLAALIREGRISYEQFAKALGKGDTIQKAAKDTFDWQEKLQTLKNKVFVLLAPIASKVFDAVGRGADIAGALLSKAFGPGGIGTKALGTLQSVLRTAVTVVGGAFSAIRDGLKFPTENLSKAGGFDKIFQGLGAALARAGSAVAAVLPKIIAGVRSILPTLAQFGAQLVDLIANHVVPLFIRFASTVLPSVLSVARSVGKIFAGSIVPAFKQLVDFASAHVIPVVKRIADGLAGFLRFLSSHQGAVTAFAKVALGLLAAKFALLRIEKTVKGVQLFVGTIRKDVGTVVNFAKGIGRVASSTAGAVVKGASFAKQAVSTALSIGRQTAAFVAQKIAMAAAAVAQKAMAVAQWALNAAMDANPVVLIVAGIAALAAGVVLAYQHFAPFRAVVDAVGRALATVARVITGVVVGAFNWVKAHWPLLAAILTGPFGLAVLAVTKFGPKVLGIITSTFSTVVSFFAAIPGRIVGALGDLGSLLFSAGQKLIGGLLRGLRAIAGHVWDFFKGLGSTIVSSIGDVSHWLYDVGHNIVKGLVNGIKDAGGFILDAIKSLGGGIIGKALSVFGIKSPSKVFAQIGGYIVDGLVLGIDRGGRVAVAAAAQLAGDVVTAGRKVAPARASRPLGQALQFVGAPTAAPVAARASSANRDAALHAIDNLWKLFQARPDLTKPKPVTPQAAALRFVTPAHIEPAAVGARGVGPVAMHNHWPTNDIPLTDIQLAGDRLAFQVRNTGRRW